MTFARNSGVPRRRVIQECQQEIRRVYGAVTRIEECTEIRRRVTGPGKIRSSRIEGVRLWDQLHLVGERELI